MGSADYFMYVLRCADGTLYTGYTVDVQQRLRTHNEGRGAKYTACRLPVTLIAQASFATKHDAMSAEFRFKRLSRSQKLTLIEEAPDAFALEQALRSRFGLGGA